MRPSRLLVQIIASVVVVGILSALIYLFYNFVENRITGSLAESSQNTSRLYADAIRGNLQRHLIVPRILSRDTKVANALVRENPALDEDFARISEEIGNASIYLVSRSGMIVNSSTPDNKYLPFDYPEVFNTALQAGNVNFFDIDRQVFVSMSTVDNAFYGSPLGVVVIEMSFAPYPPSWESNNVNMLMIRNDGAVLSSRYASDIGQNLKTLINLPETMDIPDIKFNQAYDYHGESSYLYLTDLSINGWLLVYAVPAAEAQQQINQILALVIFLLAFVGLLLLYYFSRRAARQSARLKRESEELRALNARLISEVEQRRRAERELKTAEQSLEQSAKLAVIGQLSAAVGHELNQPLAAMRTYLASVRMLLRRSRFFEAAQNLNRVDDLVDRMSGITRQMRAFARAHENEMKDFDLNAAVMNAFQLMAPQLGQMEVHVVRDLPAKPVIVHGDMLRTEQILVNLLRNGLEAIENKSDAELSIQLVEESTTARVIISDNGPGIIDPNQLFEPFYTTKEAGKGLGLGLAISASYAKDMGGNLIARNNSKNGATFELTVPKASPK